MTRFVLFLIYDDQLILVADELTRIGWLPPGDGPEQLRNGVKLSRARINIFTSYVPGNMIMAPITLFKAADPGFFMEKYEKYIKKPDMGWGRFSEKPVQIAEVPGNHVTMIAEPHAEVLAQKLDEFMEKASVPDIPLFSGDKKGSG